MTEQPGILIRPIRPEDNEPLEDIIRKAMTEFRADPRTTIIGDPALKTMYQNFQKPRSAYFIAELNGKIAGGCGIAPLEGGDENICELQRMFLAKEFRGKGTGKMLMNICIDKARSFNFRKMYLETLSDMHSARKLYESSGLVYEPSPSGSTGHTGCNVYMMLNL